MITVAKTHLNLDSIKQWARSLKRDVLAVWVAARDPQTNVLPRLIAIITAAYALSPIDLIPDFIPVIGYLDDLIIVPLGLAAVIKLIPEPHMAACRAKAAKISLPPVSYMAVAGIIAIWLAVTIYLVVNLTALTGVE